MIWPCVSDEVMRKIIDTFLVASPDEAIIDWLQWLAQGRDTEFIIFDPAGLCRDLREHGLREGAIRQANAGKLFSTKNIKQVNLA